MPFLHLKECRRDIKKKNTRHVQLIIFNCGVTWAFLLWKERRNNPILFRLKKRRYLPYFNQIKDIKGTVCPSKI